jgi:diguanylate cyclase (GGDEF)-like protein
MEILIPPHASIRLTVSLGISSVRAGESTDQVLRRVDRAMYRAKEGGRNRVAFEE